MKLTTSMIRFLKNDVLPHYILYSKADNYAYCTHCQKEIDIDFKGTRPGRQKVCPICKRTATLKAKGQTKNAFFDMGVGVILEKVDSIIIHYFDVEKTYHADGTLAYCNVHECLREQFDENGFYEAWDNAYAYGWKKCNIRQYSNWNGGAGEPCYHINTNWKIGAVYSKNLAEIIKGTPWEYSCMDKIFKLSSSAHWYSTRNFLKAYLKTQIDEYLYKVGFYNLVRCSVFGSLPVDENKKTLPEMLCVNKENYKKLLAKINPTYDDLVMYQKMTEYGFSEDDYKIYRKYFNTSSYYYARNKDYEGFRKVFPKTLYQFGKYAGNDEKFDVGFYRDYLEMCKELKYDLNNTFVLFPKDLKQAHDNCVEAINKKKLQKEKREARKQAKQYEALKGKYLERFAFEEKDLKIVVPDSTEAISKEGQDLHHCVGSYVSRVASGESIILFVRKTNKEDKSYYTMEIKDDEMTQCRGFGNKHCTAEVKKFIKNFAKNKGIVMRNIA